MVYFEELPDLCPPNEADDIALGIVFRLVKELPPTSGDFLSLAGLGKPNTSTATDCRWASCSLFRTEEAAKAKTKLPKFKECKPIGLNIPKGAGKSLIKGKHIDFWRFLDFDPLQHIPATGVV